MSQTKGSVKHIDLLDYVRGIAILSVLFYHTLGEVYGKWALPWDGLLRDFPGTDSFVYFLPFSFGQVGVAIFFVISGFCIHLSFQQQGQRWKGFFVRRFFRIYPAYFIALIFFALLIAAHTPESFHVWQTWKEWLTHLFLVHNLFPDTIISFNGSFWSLAVEAQLYLIYPALLFLVRKIGWLRTMTIVGSGEFLIRTTDGILQTIGVSNGISTILSASPLGYWFSWSLGAFLADAFLRKEPLPFSKMSAVPWVFAAGISYFFKPLFPFLFPLAAVITTIAIARFLTAPSAIKFPTFALSGLKKIGLWSYSIYLLHEPLMRFYSFGFDWILPEQYRTGPLVLLLILICWLPIIAFGVLWYKVFELTGIAIGKRIIQKISSHEAATFEPSRSKEIHQTRNFVLAAMFGGVLLVAAINYFICLKLIHPDATEDNNLAWSLATDPDATKRNGAQAVKLAELACHLMNAEEPRTFGTLAAAYAEAGRFDDAITAAQKAIDLANQKGDLKLAEQNQQLLSFYLNHQPYRVSQTNSVSP